MFGRRKLIPAPRVVPFPNCVQDIVAWRGRTISKMDAIQLRQTIQELNRHHHTTVNGHIRTRNNLFTQMREARQNAGVSVVWLYVSMLMCIMVIAMAVVNAAT